jgi:formylglycine-generating enzyme required for sulfatase activity
LKRFVHPEIGFLLCLGFLVWGVAAPASRPDAASAPSPMKAYVETIAGGKASFEMVPIPSGTFMMGSPDNERGHSADEGPQHKVTISPLWMGKTEMTWEAFDLYAYDKDIPMGAGKGTNAGSQPETAGNPDAITRPTSPYSDPTFGYGRKGHPIVSITHHAAMEFCRWLSQKTGKTYRLPTEAEWEYACRAGSTTAFGFGPTPRVLSEYAWYEANSEYMPHPAGLKKTNAWGLQDMHGNVAEWCLDLYDKGFYRKFKPLIPAVEPVLIPDAEHYPHVVRGGSWDDDPVALRCAARAASTRDWNQQDPQRPQSIWWLTDALHVGFRVVRPLEEMENLKGLRSKVTPNGGM